MDFHPHMKSRIEDVHLLDDLRYRAWAGAIADIWSVHCGPGARGEYVSKAPRLFMVLESSGELAIQPQRNTHGPVSQTRKQSLCYIPAGMPIWSRVTRPGTLKHLDLHLDLNVLQQRFGGALNGSTIDRPHLLFANARIEQLGCLLADECGSKAPARSLWGGADYRSGGGAFQVGPEPRPHNSKLPPRQLRRVTDFIEDNHARVIRLRELATLVGLSESYFCSAFKVSTGLSPHAWQMRRRIERAQALLVQRTGSLPHIAAVTGFSDQAHFTRVFKRLTGTTPAAWLRQRTQ